MLIGREIRFIVGRVVFRVTCKLGLVRGFCVFSFADLVVVFKMIRSNGFDVGSLGDFFFGDFVGLVCVILVICGRWY